MMDWNVFTLRNDVQMLPPKGGNAGQMKIDRSCCRLKLLNDRILIYVAVFSKPEG